MADRALRFGSVAQAYERFRPGYPEELFDLVAAYAGRPVRSALEIGAGTGKATRLFARPGTAVTATDPDQAMLDELRRHVPADVETVRAAFEDLRPGRRYGLVYAAAALHWTRPEGRWARMAELLAPGVRSPRAADRSGSRTRRSRRPSRRRGRPTWPATRYRRPTGRRRTTRCGGRARSCGARRGSPTCGSA